MNIPDYVNNIIDRLNSSGYEAYIVGGCVRDNLLGITPSDYDVTTNALPEEIKNTFLDYNIINVGEKFGTVVILQDEGSVEVTTYRIDGEYVDGRKPEDVEFTSSLLEDLSRRDFTINAMAYNKNTGIVDYFNGMEDLKKKIIRAVGDPAKRFDEDHLRVLRALRFSGQLNFTLDSDLYNAIVEYAPTVEALSKERIREEFFKIMLFDKPSDTLLLMEETRVLEHVISNLSKTVGYNQKTPYHVKTLFDHMLCVVDNVEPQIDVRLAALFHDIAKPDTLSIDEEGVGHFYGHELLGAEEAESILKELKTSNKLIEDVSILITEHMKAHDNMTDKALRRQIKRVSKERIFKLYDLMIADRHCTLENRDVSVLVNRKERIKELIENEGVIEKSILKINGRDLLKMGYSEGKLIGEILNYLLEQVLDNPELNNRESLEKLVHSRFK